MDSDQPTSARLKSEQSPPLEYAAPSLAWPPSDHARLSVGVALAAILLLVVAYATAADGAPVVVSLVLACAVLLCISAAIYLGIVGLQRSNEKGKAIAGIVVAVTLASIFALLVLTPSIGRPRGQANRIKCASNLRQIGYGIQLYANENKGLAPPNLGAVLLTQDLTSDVFICPSANHSRSTGPTTQAVVANLTPGKTLSYVYLYPGPNRRLDQLGPSMVLAYELPANHDHEGDFGRGGANFLFSDGSVDYVVNAQKVIDQLKAGQNPPAALAPAP
jgi:prepilin-type processing-associated H-X9-DG protein